MIIITESIDNLGNPERLTVYVQLLLDIASQCSQSDDPHSQGTQSVILFLSVNCCNTIRTRWIYKKSHNSRTQS
jgi:hypothetical protein